MTSAINVIDSVAHVDIAAKLKSVESTLSTFVEGSKVLIKALDAVQQVHPFVGGACSE